MTTSPRAARCSPGSSASPATSSTARTGHDLRFVDDTAAPPESIAGHRTCLRRKTAIEQQRDLNACSGAYAALPPHYRDVLVLVELAERSYAEAAAICGCELNTVRSRLSRARGLLTRWLDPMAVAPRAAKG